MYLTVFLGIIRWPQVMMIIALVVLFIFGMNIPKQVKEVIKEKPRYNDALSEEKNEKKEA